MRRVGNLFPAMCRCENLERAFQKALAGSGRTTSACRFHFYLERELIDLRTELMDGGYRPRPYRYFTIRDPKERTISVAAFRDRVVHHALVAVLAPVFERVFIFDSYATRQGKGTHRAILRAQEFLKRRRWFLKTDVEKYFDSVSHEILLNFIERKIKDRQILDLCDVILENNDASRGRTGRKGLPIGNLTSQFFANVCLDPFDHFVKDELGIKGYIRYMDDFVFFSDARERLKSLREVVSEKLQSDFLLFLKKKATIINQGSNGLSFLGFRIFPRLIRARRENVRRSLDRIERKVWECREGMRTEKDLVMSMRSVFDHIGHADTHRLRRNLLRRAIFREFSETEKEGRNSGQTSKAARTV